MKYLFLAIGVSLSIMAYFTPLITGERRGSEGGRFYWVTDGNPARIQQIALFEEWRDALGKKGKSLSLDTANGGLDKIIIQGVTGVAGDIIDTYGMEQVRHFYDIGLMKALTPRSEKEGFDIDATYEALYDQLYMDGDQYLFPANVGSFVQFLNLDAFEKVDLELPAMMTTIDEFEKLGSEYVKRANRGLKYQKFFFAEMVPNYRSLVRSLGLDIYNETMTATTFDDPRWIKVMDTQWKWVHDLNLVPSSAELASFASDSGYGGLGYQLFNNGNFATIRTGRWALVQFRQFDNLRMKVIFEPYFEYPNGHIGCRGSFIYNGSENLDEAMDFMAYLASEEYNLNIIEDADGLPPNPKYLKSEAYLRPAQYPEEWGMHEIFAEAATNFGIIDTLSPYHKPGLYNNYYENPWNQWKNGMATAEATVEKIQENFVKGIANHLTAGSEGLRDNYAAALLRQEEIDRLKARGEKIPLDLIDNPFYKKYYRDAGKLAE